jgi:hemerythrin-like domain-containing protein
MKSERQTSQILHREHRANLDLLGRIEQSMARAPRRDASRDADLVKLVVALGAHLSREVDRHFEFEERELFGRMADAGEGDIATLLAEEHEAIREVAAELAPLIQDVSADRLEDAGWDTLRRLALELIERMVAHIQKEEMALLPLLEDLLDDETDGELAMAYAAS